MHTLDADTPEAGTLAFGAISEYHPIGVRMSKTTMIFTAVVFAILAVVGYVMIR